MESGNVESVAKLLDYGVDVDAVTDSRTRTALMKSSELKNPDMVRFLLHRGASTGPVNFAGYPAGSLCWRESDHISKHSSMDIFKLLTENDYSNIDPHRTLNLAAMEACGLQIKSLIHLGGNVRFYDDNWQAPMPIAAFNGNHSTYIAIALHYEDIDFKHDTHLSQWLLLMTIAGKVCHSIDLSRGDVPCPEQPRSFDKIIMNMLQSGVDPETRFRVPYLELRWIPAQVRGQTIRAGEFAAAQGPDIEAWYLKMLRDCSLLRSCAEVQRLRELSEAGYGTAEFGFESAKDRDERKDTVRGDSQKRSKDSDTTSRTATEDSSTNVVDGSADNAIENPDTGGADQFWDAEEGI